MPIHLLGTSHIARQSIREIQRYIEEEKPEIIAVELDVQRAAALFEKNPRKMSWSDAFQVGFRGFLFAKIGQYLQQKLGKIVGVAPGSEMKVALELARKRQLQIAFIDQPLRTTLQNFSRQLTWKEKLRFVADIVVGLLFPQWQLQKSGLAGFHLRKVPEQELITTMMVELKQRYPNVYKTLVEDRNKYMVHQLIKLVRAHPRKKILAVVGAGHQEGMKQLLAKVEVMQ